MRACRLLLLAVLITVLGQPGCKRKSGSNQVAPAPSPSAAAPDQYHHPEGGNTPAGETKYFKGSIGSALDLQMKITREGDKLTGTYFYQKVGTKIDLKGSVDKQGNVALEEFDAGGKQTGLFKGFWKGGEDGLISFAGNWSKPNSDKQIAFSLHEEPIEFTSAVDIVAKQIKENNKQLMYAIDVQYPQLTGPTNPHIDKFNQAVKTLVTRKITEFKTAVTGADREVPPSGSMASDLSTGYTIVMARDDLISVQFDFSDYYSGAAHPNSYSQPINFDLKNGKPLKLVDLFKPEARYLPVISAYCITDLKKQSKERGPDAMLDNAQVQSGAAANPKNYQSWTINKRSLEINFDPYQVAPYAAGPQHVSVPYSALKDLINPEGPIGQFVK